MIIGIQFVVLWLPNLLSVGKETFCLIYDLFDAF